MLLKKGNTGTSVTELQNILRKLDYNVTVTGTFDEATYNAVRNFQIRHHDEKNIPLHVDGMVGDMTWKALQKAPLEVTTILPPQTNANLQSSQQALIDHLKLREGWIPKVYLDTERKPTAGMGHLLTDAENHKYKEGDAIADNILNAWASADVQTAYNEALKQAGQLSVSDQDFINALASVIFQLGAGWNKKFKNTWALMQAGKWEEAAQAVEKSKWFDQTPVRVKDFQVALRAQIQ